MQQMESGHANCVLTTKQLTGHKLRLKFVLGNTTTLFGQTKTT